MFSCIVLHRPFAETFRAMRVDEQADVPVIIIGNGPAGLSLSAFLSGIFPYYNPDTPHPDPIVDQKLRENIDKSLIDQDLEWCETIEFLGGSVRPLSILYDSLVRPGADVGAQISSRLCWQTDETRQISHLVLGETAVGGKLCLLKRRKYSLNGTIVFFVQSSTCFRIASNDQFKNFLYGVSAACEVLMMAISFSSWLDLPGFSISDWLQGTPLVPRLPSIAIAHYMKYYAKEMGISKAVIPHTRISSIEKTGDIWTVSGRCLDGRSFSHTAKHVILACGKTKNRQLELPARNRTIPIVYDIVSMKLQLLQHDYAFDTSARVVVIGDGISSADAVRVCLENKIPVLHIMRRNERQLRNSVLSRLSSLYYSEYHLIYRLMIGKDIHPLYESRHKSSVVDIDESSVLTIATSKGYQYEKCSMVVVCIGRVSDFDGVLVGKYTFSGYHSEEDPTLMCVGSFAGDHLVRYLVGGCLDVARSLHSYYRDKNNNENNDSDVVNLCAE
ncbi:hypothetical protein DICVIV_06847 [Dictyocaulus viviparus]|uniref:Pyridine nucleotide-disulfide oxidoreductase n=1 Tax=Dictyocaulus viviparus TaxID=29172 RepID=A0A0D8XTD8_DICVI|nr:hypothetical protein DICVIV_06847 [Dictyocaulus viviparus]